MISVFLPVYNEESRIKTVLDSLRWCEDVVLLDKMSTDNTVRIAMEFKNVRIFYQENTEYYTSSEFDFIEFCRFDWILLFTASDVIHANLVKKILDILSDSDNDVIEIPYRRLVLGVYSKYSPWRSEFNPSIFKKSSFIIDQNEVHKSICFKQNVKIYRLDDDGYSYMYHLTHENINMLMDRHIRYWKGVANNVNSFNELSIRNVLGAVKLILFVRKSIFYGKKGMALSFAYLSYFMMEYVYKWEKLERENIEKIYNEIKENVLNSYEE